MSQAERITPKDIENKFRELKGDVEETAESAKKMAIVIGAIAIVSIVGLAFLLGRRKGKKRATIVEVRRLS